MQIAFNSTDTTRRTVYESAKMQRMLDVSREADYIVRQTRCTRVEAMQIAESTVPQVV